MIMRVVTLPGVNEQPPAYGDAQGFGAAPAGQLPPPPAYPPGAPYANYPPPPHQQQQHTGTNGFAIASLIFGLLGGVLFGIIFGIVALTQIRKRGQRGKGMAIAGLSLAGCWLLLIAGGATYGIISAANEGPPGQRADDSMSISRLEAGDCLETLEETTYVGRMPVVACTTPHEGEVYAVFDLAEGPWPGEEKVREAAAKRCNTEFDLYAKKSDVELEFYSITPVSSDWWSDRGVICIVTDPAGRTTTSVAD